MSGCSPLLMISHGLSCRRKLQVKPPTGESWGCSCRKKLQANRLQLLMKLLKYLW